MKDEQSGKSCNWSGVVLTDPITQHRQYNAEVLPVDLSNMLMQELYYHFPTLALWFGKYDRWIEILISYPHQQLRILIHFFTRSAKQEDDQFEVVFITFKKCCLELFEEPVAVIGKQNADQQFIFPVGWDVLIPKGVFDKSAEQLIFLQ